MQRNLDLKEKCQVVVQSSSKKSKIFIAEKVENLTKNSLKQTLPMFSSSLHIDLRMFNIKNVLDFQMVCNTTYTSLYVVTTLPVTWENKVIGFTNELLEIKVTHVLLQALRKIEGQPKQGEKLNLQQHISTFPFLGKVSKEILRIFVVRGGLTVICPNAVFYISSAWVYVLVFKKELVDEYLLNLPNAQVQYTAINIPFLDKEIRGSRISQIGPQILLELSSQLLFLSLQFAGEAKTCSSIEVSVSYKQGNLYECELVKGEGTWVVAKQHFRRLLLHSERKPYQPQTAAFGERTNSLKRSLAIGASQLNLEEAFSLKTSINYFCDICMIRKSQFWDYGFICKQGGSYYVGVAQKTVRLVQTPSLRTTVASVAVIDIGKFMFTVSQIQEGGHYAMDVLERSQNTQDGEEGRLSVNKIMEVEGGDCKEKLGLDLEEGKVVQVKQGLGPNTKGKDLVVVVKERQILIYKFDGEALRFEEIGNLKYQGATGSQTMGLYAEIMEVKFGSDLVMVQDTDNNLSLFEYHLVENDADKNIFSVEINKKHVVLKNLKIDVIKEDQEVTQTGDDMGEEVDEEAEDEDDEEMKKEEKDILSGVLMFDYFEQSKNKSDQAQTVPMPMFQPASVSADSKDKKLQNSKTGDLPYMRVLVISKNCKVLHFYEISSRINTPHSSDSSQMEYSHNLIFSSFASQGQYRLINSPKPRLLNRACTDPSWSLKVGTKEMEGVVIDTFQISSVGSSLLLMIILSSGDFTLYRRAINDDLSSKEGFFSKVNNLPIISKNLKNIKRRNSSSNTLNKDEKGINSTSLSLSDRNGLQIFKRKDKVDNSILGRLSSQQYQQQQQQFNRREESQQEADFEDYLVVSGSSFNPFMLYEQNGTVFCHKFSGQEKAMVPDLVYSLNPNKFLSLDLEGTLTFQISAERHLNYREHPCSLIPISGRPVRLNNRTKGNVSCMAVWIKKDDTDSVHFYVIKNRLVKLEDEIAFNKEDNVTAIKPAFLKFRGDCEETLAVLYITKQIHGFYSKWRLIRIQVDNNTGQVPPQNIQTSTTAGRDLLALKSDPPVCMAISDPNQDQDGNEMITCVFSVDGLLFVCIDNRILQMNMFGGNMKMLYYPNMTHIVDASVNNNLVALANIRSKVLFLVWIEEQKKLVQNAFYNIGNQMLREISFLEKDQPVVSIIHTYFISKSLRPSNPKTSQQYPMKRDLCIQFAPSMVNQCRNATSLPPTRQSWSPTLPIS